MGLWFSFQSPLIQFTLALLKPWYPKRPHAPFPGAPLSSYMSSVKLINLSDLEFIL